MSLFVARRLGLIAVVVIAAGACSPQSSVAAAQGQAQEDSQPAPVAIPVAASILIIYRQVIIPRQNER